jgi:hypothetical protein
MAAEVNTVSMQGNAPSPRTREERSTVEARSATLVAMPSNIGFELVMGEGFAYIRSHNPDEARNGAVRQGQGQCCWCWAVV